jgi:hypothetical protein
VNCSFMYCPVRATKGEIEDLKGHSVRTRFVESRGQGQLRQLCRRDIRYILPESLELVHGEMFS